MDGFIKIIFVKSEKNKSDIFTKNVSNEVYDKHRDSYIKKKDYLSSD